MLYRIMGTGEKEKRTFLLRLAKESFEAGKRVFVIVPEQASAQYERDLVSLCGNGCNALVEVTNFSRLSNIVLRSYGNLARRSVTEEEKKLLLAVALRDTREETEHLNVSARPEGVDALYGELEELRLAGLDEKALTALEETEAIPEALSQKLRDLTALRAAFEKALSLRFDDPAEEESRLAEILRDYSFFRDSVVILDLFWDFTAPQKLLLKRFLAQSETVAVSFLADFAQKEIFDKTCRAAREVRSLAEEVGCGVRDEKFFSPEKSGELAFLRAHLVDRTAPWDKVPEQIHLTPCENAEQECSFVAHTIGEMIRRGGCWQDFAVLSRTGEEFTLLAPALEEAGIPYFLEKKEPLSASSLAKTLLFAVRIATGDGRTETVRAYLSNGIIDCEEEERFLLEKYIATWSPPGRQLLDDGDFVMNPEGYHKMYPRQIAELAAVNRAKKKIFRPLRDLSLHLVKGKNEDKVSALVAFLGAIGAERILFGEMDRAKKEDDWEEAGRLLGMWNTVLERLSGIARAVGERESEPEEFLAFLSLALSGSLPGSIPSGQDRVQVGLLGFMRPHKVKHVFLMGLSAGSFPAPIPRGKILTDRERENLAQYGYPLSYGDRLQAEETFLFYLAASLPEENLFLSFLGEVGKKADNTLSVFGKRVKHLFPKLEYTPFDPEKVLPVHREEALRTFLNSSREAGDLQEALKEYFLDKEPYRTRLLLSLSGKAFAHTEFSLEKEKPFFGEDIHLSYSTLESYVKCRFYYFARYLLDAKDTPTSTFGANVTGTFIHRVLEIILSRLAQQKKTLSDLSEKELKEENEEACKKALLDLAATIPDDNALQLLVRRIKRSSLLILKNLREEFQKSQFEPLFFEKTIDQNSGYSIPLPDGTSLTFKGSIDRVDRYIAPDGKEYVRVVDYKTGSHAFSLEDVANGLDLQMLIYLYSLWGKSLTPNASPAEPAGVLYLNGMEKATNCSDTEELQKVASSPFGTLSREGLLVDDPLLLAAQDPDGQGEFIPVGWNKKTKTGKVSVTGKKNLVTLAELGRLKKKNEELFAHLAAKIKEGEIAPNPLYSASKKIDPCVYCQLLPICKRSTECRRPFRTGLKKEEIFG